jgi:hypothetical protein
VCVNDTFGHSVAFLRKKLQAWLFAQAVYPYLSQPMSRFHRPNLSDSPSVLEIIKYLGTVPELVRETIAMNWAVDGEIERRFQPKDGFKDQFRRLLSRLGAHRMR